MAAGKVLIGFSKPYVAVYQNNNGVITYTNGQILARGVSVETELQTGSESRFYADNVQAESGGGVFTGGQATLTVDGLFMESKRLILGLPEARKITVNETQVDIIDYGDSANPPYMGVGFITQYMSDGVITYTPTMFRKVKFQTENLVANTQGEEIEWQPQALIIALMRDDSAEHNWKSEGADQDTEEEAEAVLKVLLGITEE